MFYKFIEMGKRIIVEPSNEKENNNYSTTTFSLEKGKVMADNSFIGKFENVRFTKCPEDFDLHICKMLCEGFRVVIE